MSWSTRRLAELAGTSSRAVRHYHEVGLLPEPPRRANGHKRYGVAHLTRLLRVTQLRELGVPLGQIAELLDSDDPCTVLGERDAALSDTIARLQRTRAELAVTLGESLPTDLPPEIARAIELDPDMSAADRSLLVVLSRVLGPESLQTYVDMLRDTPVEPATKEFDRLPADADVATREDLAGRLAPYVGSLRSRYPTLTAPPDPPRGTRYADQILRQARLELYNPAQRDVMSRIDILLGGD